MKLSVVIPCFNEAQSLPAVLSGIEAALDRDDVEVIFVDNGSRDGTGSILSDAAKTLPWARHVSLIDNAGYGGGLQAGLAVARGAWLGWTHGDGQTDFGDVLRGLAIIEASGAPTGLYIKGQRRGRAWGDRVFTVGMGWAASVVFGRRMSDINAEPNLFHRSFYDTWRQPPTDYQIELYAVAQAMRQGLRMVRVSVDFPPREAGSSSWNTGLGAQLGLSVRTLRAMVGMRVAQIRAGRAGRGCRSG